MELSRIKQLEHLEPLERLEPSSHHLRIRINQCWSFFYFDDLDLFTPCVCASGRCGSVVSRDSLPILHLCAAPARRSDRPAVLRGPARAYQSLFELPR